MEDRHGGTVLAEETVTAVTTISMDQVMTDQKANHTIQNMTQGSGVFPVLGGVAGAKIILLRVLEAGVVVGHQRRITEVGAVGTIGIPEVGEVGMIRDQEVGVEDTTKDTPLDGTTVDQATQQQVGINLEILGTNQEIHGINREILGINLEIPGINQKTLGINHVIRGINRKIPLKRNGI